MSGARPQPIFVVQRHDARRLHYDFRLEENGALASWAVPKGVPLEPGARALAVHVEDHPLEYGELRGRDPAGPVRRGLGRALGHRHLRARRAQAERPAHGRPARPAASRDLVARAGAPRRQGGELAADQAQRRRGGAAPRREYSPMLATPAETRAARRRLALRGEVRRLSRARVRARRRVPPRLAQRQRPDPAIRRGREGGRRRDQVAERRARRRGLPCRCQRPRELLRAAAGQRRARLLRRSTCSRSTASRSSTRRCTERKQRLRALLDGRNRTVSFSEDFDDGDALFRVAEERGLEGVVAKRAEQRLPARAGEPTTGSRSRPTKNDEFVIVGYTRGRAGGRSTFGVARARRLRGRRAALRRQRRHRLRRRGDRQAAAAARGRCIARRRRSPRCRSCRGSARATCSGSSRSSSRRCGYGEWTHDRHLRHPSYLGLRDDKAPAEVVREDVDPARQARAQAVEPRQALLAGRGDHEGRPAPLLPRGRAGARAAPRAPARSRCAAIRTAPTARRSSRRTRRPTCPTGSRASARTSRRATRRGRRSGSSSRSSTTSWRCSGW